MTLQEHPQWLAHHTDRTLPTPAIVQLELTAACDLACVMCPLPHETRHGTGGERFEVADLERERALFAAAAGVELTGFGEILCHPHLLDCLRWFRTLGLGVAATSNGNRLTDELTRAIVGENLLDVLCLSIDAATPATYERIRRRGDFAQLRRNVDCWASRRGPGAPRLRFSFAAMEPNIRELPAFVRWAAQAGAERVIVQHIYEAPHTQGWGLQHHRELARAVLAEAGALADELGVTLDGRNLAQQGAAGHRPGLIKDCPFPWAHTFVKANRRVAACAMVWEDLDLGDLRDGFTPVWRGNAYTEFRRAMAGATPPAPCVRCQYFGWREPTPLAELSPATSMEPAQRGRLGWQWHGAERDPHGRAFRWSLARSSLFLHPHGRTMLQLDAQVDPRGPFMRGVVRLGERAIAFDSHDLWGQPLRLPFGRLPDEPQRVEISLEKTWNPGVDAAIAGLRRLGLLVYGAEMTGAEDELVPRVDAADRTGQLGRGWLAVETVAGREARWLRERADLLLGGSGKALLVQVLVPVGLNARTLSLSCDDRELGEQAIPADGRWHDCRFAVDAPPIAPARITLGVAEAAPAPHDTAERPRLFGALVAAVGWAD
ncbi:MAG TPA: radical SAM protein [bacterium]|nr:radical SAM protein [bacterium]